MRALVGNAARLPILCALTLAGGAWAASPALAAPSPQDPAELVPENTLVYFGTYSVREGAKASRNSAMAKVLAEPEVQQFLAKPLAAADEALAAFVKQGGDMAAIDGQAPSFSVKGLFEPSAEGPPLGRVFFALTHVGLGPNSAQGIIPDIGAIVGVELLEAADLAMVRGYWDKIPGPTEEASRNGKPYFRKVIGEGDGPSLTIGLAFLGNLAVASASEKALGEIIDRFYGGSAPPASLASTAGYRQMLDVGGGLKPAGSSYFLQIAGLVGMGKQLLGMAVAMEDDPQAQEILPKVLQLIDGLGLEGIRWVGGLSSREADGRVLSTSACSFDPRVTGLIAQLREQERPLDLARLAKMPGDALSVSGASMSGLGVVYDYLRKAAESFAPEEFAGIDAQIKAVMGEFDLRNDLLDNLSGAAWAYSLPNQTFAGTPATLMSIQLRQPDRFIGALRKLLEFASQLLEQEMGVAGAIGLKESMHGDLPFYELDLSKSPMGMMLAMMQPSFAVKDGELVACVESPQTLRSVLNGEAGKGSISEKAAFMAFVDDLKARGEVLSVSCTDVAKTFGSAYGQLAGVAQMMAGSFGAEVPVDLSLMPSEQAIAKHLGEAYSGAVRQPEKSLYVSRSSGQFAVGDFLPLLVAGGVLGAAHGQHAAQESMKDAGKSPEDVVLAQLGELKAGLTVYKISQGAYPASLDDLVKPLPPDYPNGPLDRETIDQDPWGNAYRYKLEGKTVMLWSTGPNGIDESGAGDDILKK